VGVWWGLLGVSGFEAAGVVEGHAVVVLIDEALAAEAGEEAADGFAGEACHAAELFLVKLHVEGNGNVGWVRAVTAVVCAGPVEKGAGEFSGGGGVESEATRGEEGALILARNGQSGDEVDLGVGFHGADEIGAGDGFDGARAERLGSDAVGGLLVQSGQAEDVAGAGDAEQEETAVAGGGSDFHASGANKQEVIGRQAFVEEDGVRFAIATNSDRIEVAQSLGGERAEGRGVENRTVWTVARKNGWPPGSRAREAKAIRCSTRGRGECCTGLL